MNEHCGQIIERKVRRDGYSITELALRTNVNRRSVYNWFNQKYLKPEIISRIGKVINHDFRAELPHLKTLDSFDYHPPVVLEKEQLVFDVAAKNIKDENFWKDKYIQLLEECHELLAIQLDASKSVY